MQRSYLGIGTTRELQFWTPETPDARPFVLKRARRVRDGVCFWAVVPDEIGGQIEGLLREGRRRQALETLNDSVIDAGRFFQDER